MADEKPIVPDPAYQGIAATSPQPQDVTSPEAQKHYETMFPVHPEATTIDLRHPLAQVADRSMLDLFMGMVGGGEGKTADFIPLPHPEEPFPERHLAPAFPKGTWVMEDGTKLHQESDGMWRDAEHTRGLEFEDANGVPDTRDYTGNKSPASKFPQSKEAYPPKRGPSGGIVAHHGSPHDFEQFDISKIGIGEGSQIAGHGLYFADQEAVAKTYRDLARRGVVPGGWNPLTTPSRAKYAVEGVPMPTNASSHGALDTGTDLEGLLYYLKSSPQSTDSIKFLKERIENRIANHYDMQSKGTAGIDMRAMADFYNQYIKHLDPAHAASVISEPPAGRMYEVELQTDPLKLLDLDMPIVGQSKAVQSLMPGEQPQVPAGIRRLPKDDPRAQAFKQGGFRPEGTPEPDHYWEIVDKHGNSLVDYKYDSPHEALRTAMSERAERDPREWSGGDLQRYLSEQNILGTPSPPDIIDKFGLSGFDPPRASQVLQEAGIPGNRFLDKFSRERREGSHNYVIWDQGIIRILDKYGLAGLATGAGAAGLLGGESQAQAGDIGDQARDDQVLAQQGQKATEQIPYGPIKVQAQRLLPEYNDLGKTRPFGPGEAVQMPDGGMTSEETLTVQMPNGKWSVIPGLWLVNGVPTKVTEDQAVALATRSGLDWPYTFDNQQQADAYAVQREATWEKTPMSLSMTTAQPALWKRRNGTRSSNR